MAYLTFGISLGDAHHATNVTTSSVGVSSVISDMVSISSQQQANFTSNSALMSGIHSNLPFTPNLEHSIFSAKTINREAFSAFDWVIDTRATDHRIHFVSCFTSITVTLNTHVNLPNDENSLVTHIRTIQISKKLIIYNVLCVPSFSFNLIYVSRLAKSILCCLMKCFISNEMFHCDICLLPKQKRLPFNASSHISSE